MWLPILQISQPNNIQQFNLTKCLTIRMLADCLIESNLELGDIGQSCIEKLKNGQLVKTQLYNSKNTLVDVELQVIYSRTIVLK